jgi:adenylate cyclase
MSVRYSKILSSLVGEVIGKLEFTSLEVAREAGVDPEDAWLFWRALGFPRVPSDERAFTRQDVAMLRAAREVLAREDAEPEILLQITRVSGQALARMVGAQALPISAAIKEAMRAPDKTDAEATDVVVSATEALLAAVEPFLSYAWRRHLLAAVSQVAASAERTIGDEAELTIGFADLVDFTAVSQQLTHREIARTVDRFVHLAYEHIPEHGGRIVKMIGDEVMFSTAEAEAAVEIALSLVEACAGDEVLPHVRVGLASGPTLAWEGDVYGPVVNLASRLVNVARPGTVLVSEELAGQLGNVGSIVIREVPRQNLKGIGKMRPRVVRRAPAADEAKQARRGADVEPTRADRRRGRRAG